MRTVDLMRRLALGLFATSMLAGLPARADEPDRLRGVVAPVVAKKSFKIGVTLVHLNDDFWKGIAYGIADEAKRSNVQLVQVTIAGAYGNVPQQFEQLETLNTLGVDVAVIGAAAFKGYDSVLKRLKQSGIMVVAAGIPVDSRNVDFGITQDDTAIGAALADAVCRNMGGKPSSVITIPGPAGAEWARLRHVGFDDQARKCKGLDVFEGAMGGSLGLEQGLSQGSDLLQTHSDAGYVYTPEISLGLGAAQAVKQAHANAKGVSSSIVREAIPLIQDGRILAAASEPGIIMGRLVVQYAIREREKLPTPALKVTGSPYPTVLVPTTLITQSNVKTYPFDLYEIPPKAWSIQALQ